MSNDDAALKADAEALNLVMEWKRQGWKGSITLHFPGNHLIGGVEEYRKWGVSELTRRGVAILCNIITGL